LLQSDDGAPESADPSDDEYYYHTDGAYDYVETGDQE
jgi:hypothetical protein